MDFLIPAKPFKWHQLDIFPPVIGICKLIHENLDREELINSKGEFLKFGQLCYVKKYHSKDVHMLSAKKRD